MAIVDKCPGSKEEVTQASIRLKCGNDEYGNNQYLCVPNVEKTSLVEFCYSGLMGWQKKGHCIEAQEGDVTIHSCIHFLSGCPKTDFKITTFYEYPACQQIDSRYNCYTKDPSCPPKSNGSNVSYLSIYLSLGTLVFSVVIVCVLLYLCCKRKHIIKDHKGSSEGIPLVKLDAERELEPAISDCSTSKVENQVLKENPRQLEYESESYKQFTLDYRTSTVENEVRKENPRQSDEQHKYESEYYDQYNDNFKMNAQERVPEGFFGAPNEQYNEQYGSLEHIVSIHEADTKEKKEFLPGKYSEDIGGDDLSMADEYVWTNLQEY